VDVFDCAKSKENLLYRIAYAFCSGDLLSIILKNGGMIHWGWGALWEKESPEQEPAIALIKNLNEFRKRHGEFLQHGRMEKPLLSVRGGSFAMRLNTRDETADSFLHSAWTAPNGKRAEVIANFLPQEQRVHVDFPRELRIAVDGRGIASGTEITLDPLNAVCVRVEQQ
jgi:hypothetical protein